MTFYVIVDTNIIVKALEGDPSCMFVISVLLNPCTDFKILFDRRCNWHDMNSLKTLFDELRDKIFEEGVKNSGIRFIFKTVLRSLLQIFPRDKVEHLFICDIAGSIWRRLQRSGMRDIDDVKLIALARKASCYGAVLVVTDDSDLLNIRDDCNRYRIEIISSSEFFRRFYSGPFRS